MKLRKCRQTSFIVIRGSDSGLGTGIGAVEEVPTVSCGHMSVVCGSDNRDCRCTARVGVAQTVSDLLEVISGETDLVAQNMVVGGPRSSNGRMADEVKIVVARMTDGPVDDGSRRHVAEILILEEPGVVFLLNHHEGDPRIVILFHGPACRLEGAHLLLQNLLELGLTHAVPEHQNLLRLPLLQSPSWSCGFQEELHQKILNHAGVVAVLVLLEQPSNDLHLGLLSSDAARIPRKSRPFEGGHRRGHGWRLGVARRAVRNIEPENNGGDA
ncbi:hypothetical protein Mapa_007260 [Marchantia paleacea]|nr:hypothetical protein Mapa_007260 [Marchantia paleacea]